MAFIVKKALQQVVESGNYYQIQVNGNQPHRRSDKIASTYAKLLCEVIVKLKILLIRIYKAKKTWKNDYLETNVYQIISNETTQKWSQLNCFIITLKEVVHKDKIVNTIAYRITNIDDLPASIFHNGIRGHWVIEHRIHWVQDVIFWQDANALTNATAAANMAFF